MKTFAAIIIILIQFNSIGQNGSIVQREDSLAVLLNDLRAATNNQEKEVKNKRFQQELEKTLALPEAYSYSFSKLKTLGVIDSPDGLLRIVNWNVEQDDLSHKYYCYVLYPEKRGSSHNVVQFQDISFGMPTQPTEILSADQWYGALYYKIIPLKKGNRTLYTVLAWDYFSDLSQIKLIDVMYVSGNTIKLGNPVFKVGKETLNRVYFEHSKKTSMYLNYEPDRKRIMMDHLSPESPRMKNFKAFYVPDLSYDAFMIEGNRWVLHEDVIGVNHGNGEKKQVVYVKNEKTGELEEKVIKTTWQNPEDPGAPAGGTEHVAVTPDELDKNSKNDKSAKESRKQKKDKRDPSELSIFKDLKKKKSKRN